MKNYEKYLEELIDSLGVSSVDCGFIHKRVFHEQHCNGRTCSDCNVRFKEWLKEEYNPPIDWSKVPINTPVLVKDETYNAWKARYFVTYLPTAIRQFAVFDAGATHETASAISQWECCKLAREEDIEKYSI